MKILITDGLSAQGQAILKKSGIEYDIHFYEPDELIKAIVDYDCVLVRSATKIPKEVIDAGKKLKVIARGGAGIDNIDHVYALSKGIPVLNTPAANSASVAELAIAHMFVLARFLHQSNISMREGKWEKKKYKGIELAGKTLGLIGCGKIGRLTAEKALGLGMKVVGCDPIVKDLGHNAQIHDFEEVLRESDFISLHVPKMKEALIGKKEIAMMKDGVYIINCSRGGVVDENALLEALNSGKVAGAGLDVFVNEPTDNMALISHPNVSVTPHVGASTNEAQDRVGVEIAEKIVAALK
ncbi:MAG: D-2-hydroxyacid dehydrogenase [Candidatus Neomarinimicrobiota bacterium]|jgi:D-3-phosphoglycerate dehydrogenase|nr:D-2-hydroxyacid dehydrogenase [Candidatus Neomarinimicrobiota bacterium]MDD3965545.1 D-2-hydroxyacid dehydrogenase [Candidatus Neomarinimicrobiota bacterium]MDX9780698.1 D-2-hydroxyacid dehydrogenase [bacterium]